MHTPAPVRSLPRALALFLALTLPALAHEVSETPSGYFKFQIENDVFYSDRNYTQGLRLESMRAYGDDCQLVRTALTKLCLTPRPGDLTGWYFGQLMFTPSDLRDPNPPRTDRPYAGWMFLGVQRMRFGKNEPENIVWRDTVAVSAGVTGPWSLAEDAQQGLHSLFRDDEHPEKGWVNVQGWHTQLPTEPTVDVFWERKALASLFEWRRLELQVLPYVNANVGTVTIAARTGATFRVGFNLPRDFAHAPIPLVPAGAPSLKRAPASEFAYTPERGGKQPVPRFGLHGFVSIEGKFIARNLFLDGTLRPSRRIDKEVALHDIVWGAELTLCCWRFTYSHVNRGREFVGQKTDQVFHSVAITFDR